MSLMQPINERETLSTSIDLLPISPSNKALPAMPMISVTCNSQLNFDKVGSCGGSHIKLVTPLDCQEPSPPC